TTAVVMNDGFGNVLGVITNNAVGWNASRESLYAPVEGYAPPRLSLAAPAHASLAWRTRPANAAGYIQLGARPYDPIRRAFMAPDPLGHDADPALNTAFGGNPAAFFDADGRDWKLQYDIAQNPELARAYMDLYDTYEKQRQMEYEASVSAAFGSYISGNG